MNSEWPFLVFLADLVVGIALIIVGFFVTFDAPQNGWIIIGIGVWLEMNCSAMGKIGNE